MLPVLLISTSHAGGQGSGVRIRECEKYDETLTLDNFLSGYFCAAAAVPSEFLAKT